MPRRASPTEPPKGPEPRGMRMAELSRRSGIARETIHFYLREGLIPRPQKGGATVSYYGEEHLERLRIIRRLREEKYLPIAVIRRLLESPAAPGDRDVDVLAEVLNLIPAALDRAAPPSAEALAVAEERRLIGGARGTSKVEIDPAERRVLRVVDEALALGPEARALTLDDVEACAASLSALVNKEAELVFDAMFATGDVTSAIGALRSGRPAVARFIAAYRDLLLRRVVEDVLVALEEGPEMVLRAATIPLSAAREEALGVPSRRAALRAAAFGVPEDPRAAIDWVWHLVATGASAELASAGPQLAARADARLACLMAWAAYDSARGAETLAAFDRAVAAAPGFALGQILLGEAVVARGLRRRHGGASVLEQAVPALHRVVSADPDLDPEPVARALGWFHRGRTELALPPVLGRASRGVTSLEKALAVLASEPAIDPGGRARIAGNARLALGRHWMARGDTTRALASLLAASLEDPEGGLGRAAREIAGRAPLSA